jgi:hypothetical protein
VGLCTEIRLVQNNASTKIVELHENISPTCISYKLFQKLFTVKRQIQIHAYLLYSGTLNKHFGTSKFLHNCVLYQIFRILGLFSPNGIQNKFIFGHWIFLGTNVIIIPGY